MVDAAPNRETPKIIGGGVGPSVMNLEIIYDVLVEEK